MVRTNEYTVETMDIGNLFFWSIRIKQPQNTVLLQKIKHKVCSPSTCSSNVSVINQIYKDTVATSKSHSSCRQ